MFLIPAVVVIVVAITFTGVTQIEDEEYFEDQEDEQVGK